MGAGERPERPGGDDDVVVPPRAGPVRWPGSAPAWTRSTQMASSTISVWSAGTLPTIHRVASRIGPSASSRSSPQPSPAHAPSATTATATPTPANTRRSGIGIPATVSARGDQA